VIVSAERHRFRHGEPTRCSPPDLTDSEPDTTTLFDDDAASLRALA
jgi:hypothetical protein